MFFMCTGLMAQETENSKDPLFIQQVNFDLYKKNEESRTIDFQENTVPSALILSLIHI